MWWMKKDGSGFVLYRNFLRITHFHGSREQASACLREIRDQHASMSAILATGDPLEVCRAGWHLLVVNRRPDGRGRSVSTYFRFGARISEAGGSLVYWIAPKPFRYLAGWVKTIGSTTPWRCAVCGRDVDARE